MPLNNPVANLYQRGFSTNASRTFRLIKAYREGNMAADTFAVEASSSYFQAKWYFEAFQNFYRGRMKDRAFRAKIGDHGANRVYVVTMEDMTQKMAKLNDGSRVPRELNEESFLKSEKITYKFPPPV